MREIALTFLEEIYRATMRRDRDRLRALLKRPAATHLPREVRAEAMAIVAAPPASLRAPIRLLQFRQRVLQLGLPRSGADAEGQLELDLKPRRAASRRSRR
jgi:anti-sigma factor RsiW